MLCSIVMRELCSHLCRTIPRREGFERKCLKADDGAANSDGITSDDDADDGDDSEENDDDDDNDGNANDNDGNGGGDDDDDDGCQHNQLSAVLQWEGLRHQLG